jgi:hypothetical protein
MNRRVRVERAYTEGMITRHFRSPINFTTLDVHEAGPKTSVQFALAFNGPRRQPQTARVRACSRLRTWTRRLCQSGLRSSPLTTWGPCRKNEGKTRITNFPHSLYRAQLGSPNRLLLNSAPNLGPLIPRWEIDKFENCSDISVSWVLEILKLLFQQFLNLSISQRDMSGPIVGDWGYH